MTFRFPDSRWSSNSIKGVVCYNPLWRERDVVEVLNSDKEQVGFLVSRGIFTTDDDTLIRTKWLPQYITTWLKDYYQCSYADIGKYLTGEEANDDNSCILLLHKDELAKYRFPENAVNAFLFSFFCGKTQEISRNQFYENIKDLHYEKIKNHPKRKMLDPLNNDASSYIINECYPKLESVFEPISMFSLLYQYFEVLMDIGFEPQIKHFLQEYLLRKKSKNDFRELVSGLANEGRQLKELLSTIPSHIFDEISESDKLTYFGDSNIREANEIIYKARNSIFHRTRKFLHSGEFISRVNFCMIGAIYYCITHDILHENSFQDLDYSI